MNPFASLPLRVLMLEDSRFDAELVSESLLASYPRAQVRLVADEAGFVDALRMASFDLVLSDYEIPGYGGPEALDHVRDASLRVPFIIVSGVIGEENAVEMLKRGATDYVSKNRLARLPLVIERALREAADRAARERAERQLRKADAIYGRVVDALNDYAVVLLDAHGTIREWNRGAGVIFGLSRDEAVGSPLARLFTEDDVRDGVVARELEQARLHGSASDDRWLRRADGSLLRADGVLTALRDDADEVSAGDLDGHATIGFCKIVRDITSAYESAAALQAAKSEAERANAAKDRFLAVLSHELRTPLSPIASAAQLLEQRAVVPPEHRGLLPMIRRNVALEARLIEDLLDLTSIAAGKVSLRLAPVDMRELVDIVVDMVAETVAEKDIALTVFRGALRTWVDGDAARLQQVLWNIVRNAVKFTPRGGHVEVRTDDDGGWFRLRCIDDGIGIPEAAQSKIFSAFEQADSAVARQYGGLGLGLAIARGLVSEHGGSLEVASAGEGAGATFTLRLATRPAGRPAPIEASDDGAASPPGAPGVRLLLVEDNDDAALAMTMSFEHFGYRVTHAATLRAALAAAGDATFDVVVTDLGLPDGSGIEVGRALAPALPVIALSGYGTPEDLRRTREAGFVAHLVKPVDPETLHATVMSVLAGAGR